MKYRIVTNGNQFKIEELIKSGFWFWSKMDWQEFFTREFNGTSIYRKWYYFDTCDEAEEFVSKLIKQENAEKHGWKVVKEIG